MQRKPTWGTCAGLILLAESANRTKKGGQDLIGGLDVRVNRNHFGRQKESFMTDLNLPFLSADGTDGQYIPFPGVFIRAPVVEKVLQPVIGAQSGEAARDDTVIAPSKSQENGSFDETVLPEVEIMARLPGRSHALQEQLSSASLNQEDSDIIAVRQANVFGSSFHPELTQDARIHVWWLTQVIEAVQLRRSKEKKDSCQ